MEMTEGNASSDESLHYRLYFQQALQQAVKWTNKLNVFT
jgi:hypothetical protein